MEKIIIYGTGKLAQMVFYLLEGSNEYQVEAFCAKKEYCNSDDFLEKPLIDFSKIELYYPPSSYKMLTVIGGLGGTGLRKTMYDEGKEKGYEHINYIHPTVIIQGKVEMGENNIIFPNSIIGFSGKFGNNNLVREKTYIGHDFNIGDHCFIGVDCNIGGEGTIRDLNYIAMNTTITNNVYIEEKNFIGIGSLILKNIEDIGGKYYGRPGKRVGDK